MRRVQRWVIQPRRPASSRLHAVCGRHLQPLHRFVFVHGLWPGDIRHLCWRQFVDRLPAMCSRHVRRRPCSDSMQALQSRHWQSHLRCISLCPLHCWYVLELQRLQFVHTLQCRHIQPPKRVIRCGSLPALPPRAGQPRHRLNVVLSLRPLYLRPRPGFFRVQRVPCR